MADIYKFSERTIDLAERLADIADAAQGKGGRRGGIRTRWLILPAAGAGLYALTTSRFFARQAKNALDEAKSRASELPEDLVGRVQKASSSPDSGQASSRRANGRKQSQKSGSSASGRKASRKSTATR